MKIVLIVFTMAAMHVLTMRSLFVESARNASREQAEHEVAAHLVCASPSMSLSEMTARAAALTGRLMACFGEAGAAQCRPVEVSQTEHPEIRVAPVVACFAGQCQVVSQ